MLRPGAHPRTRYSDGRVPHQLSGGMRQRVVIAIALACRPALVIADDPTTALDVTVRAQILDLIKGLQGGMSVILITHDMGVIAESCDEVVVMYAGRVVEKAPVIELFVRPLHAYTRGLLASIPRIDTVPKTRLAVIRAWWRGSGIVPAGAASASRCTHAASVCIEAVPPLQAVRENHTVSCVAEGWP